MLLRNQIKPYELVRGETESKVSRWISLLSQQVSGGKGLRIKPMKKNLKQICLDFSAIGRLPVEKVKVGIVGEIYVKYARIANNNLEDFLVEEEGCEVNVPGLMGFILYCTDNYLEGRRLYGEHKLTAAFVQKLADYLVKMENAIRDAVSKYTRLEAPPGFYQTKDGVKGIIGYGAKMGEGWLLTAEMAELITAGVENVICTQPFGCLPNHISGKGMMKKLKDLYPSSNIVAIDYDPGATRVNQENRIKLMLAVAREQLAAQDPVAAFVKHKLPVSSKQPV